ncbi:isopentenyl-diphosphate Delta-isomerase [Nocardia asteroides]|uniref:isopentenyl-diphosphate Delta-isomerase n=1 Tax=Nocardia asteroides TaxID=1824 RepID=UPI001E337626|nr:isopentenyl-diphosphate Delta-isomerase [Nocardia asteroides]UGT61497.1 isopentenyl-diphosphate Delta-isomerase [Nocardia asteroides]
MVNDAAPTGREALPIELVDAAGAAVGTCSVARAHRSPGMLHRAFSVLLFDASGRVLLQQRAAVKTRFPLRWANTCCGHPAPGQPVTEAAGIRLREELGLGAALREAGAFTYRAADPRTGRVEFEYDHVVVGPHAGDEPHPDPAEVADYAWVEPGQLGRDLREHPQRYAPWLGGVLELALVAPR